MRNYKIIILATFMLASIFQNANANPYFGVGYQFNQLNYNSASLSGFGIDLDDYLEKDFNNINLFAGYKINDNMAIELGYFSKKDENKTNSNTGLVWTDTSGTLTTNTKSDLQIINLDGIYSFEANSKLNFLTIASISKIDANSKISYLDDGVSRSSESLDDNGFGIGGGIGLEVELIKNISARIVAKYTHTLGIDSFDNLISYNAALKYQF